MAELAFDLEPTEVDRLDQAEALVRSYCGWHISPPRPNQVETLAYPVPMMTLRSLMVTEMAIEDADGNVIDPDSYVWTSYGTIHPRTCSLGRGTKVTYTSGFEMIPPEVTAVVQAVAKRAVDNPGSLIRNQAGPFAVTHSQTGANQSTALALLDSEMSLLDKYRIFGRP